jgi:hypothetical protein
VRISNIRVTAFVPLAIDIKPGETPNSINSTSTGNIPVAILSTDSFNAPARIAPTSLTFGRTGDERSFLFCHQDDANGDGLVDLICHFDTGSAGFRAGDQRGNLKGQTSDGVPVVGSDVVRIVR